MQLFYDYFFPAIWAAFLLYWQVKARNTKETQRLEPISPASCAPWLSSVRSRF